jgi:large subunit ribosomal protein L15
MRNKQKKNVRQRGSKTHGCGSMKKRRGAGNRGGRGMAGTGKRGDCKKTSIWKNKRYFGPLGFTSIKTRAAPVNLEYIEGRAETLAKQGIVKKNGGFYELDLKDIGRSKLLSKGRVSRKYRIKCSEASKGAIEKVKKAGGVVKTDVPVQDNIDEPA